MKNIFFFDTETTGLTEPRLVQLAWKLDGQPTETFLFKPTKQIEVGASAVHHITDEKVADKEFFAGSVVKTILEDHLKNNVAVAHNAKFDLMVLKNEGVDCKFVIDTLRLARHLTGADKHNLQHLRYHFKIDILAVAHDAGGDVDVLEQVFYKLVEIAKEASGITEHKELLTYLINLSKEPVLLKTMPFGKHKGREFIDILHTDRSYLEWLVETKEAEIKVGKADPDDDVYFTCLTWLRHERPQYKR